MSSSARRVEWQVGAYFSHESYTNDQFLDALDLQLVPIPSLTPFVVAYLPATYQETALFGTLTWHLTDRLDVTAGVRGLTNKQVDRQVLPPQVLLPPSNLSSAASQTLANYAFSPRYHPWHDSMVFLRVASGYRPGTPNYIDPHYPQIPPATTADTMIDYEVGSKTEFLDRRASVELTVFKQKLSNLQTVVATPDGAVLYGINAGKVTSEGFEVATLYTPANAWYLALNAAYTDTYATEAVPSAGIAAGARMPTSPMWTASATVDYRFSHLGQWSPSLAAGWRYIDRMYTTISSRPPVGVIPGYSLFDLSLQLANSCCEISLYAKNPLDKRAYNSAAVQTSTVTGANFFYGTLVQPRLIGLTVNVHLR